MRLFLLLGNFLLIVALLAPAPAQAGPVALDELAARLGSQDKSVQARAMRELAALGQEPLPELARLLGDGEPAQRRGGAIGLAMLPMPGFATGDLLAALNDEDTAVRSLAAYGLALIGKPAARDAAALLGSPSERVRNGAAYALMLMQAKGVDGLIRALAADDPLVRAKAAWLLGRIGPEARSAVPALARALDTPDIRAVHVIAEALDLIAPDPAVLAFHFIQLGETATRPVARLGGHGAPILVKLLNRPGTLSGQVAFRALATMGRAALPALLAALEYGTPGQRVAAALLLVDYDPDFVSSLPEDVRDILAGAGRE